MYDAALDHGEEPVPGLDVSQARLLAPKIRSQQAVLSTYSVSGYCTETLSVPNQQFKIPASVSSLRNKNHRRTEAAGRLDRIRYLLSEETIT